MSQGMLVGWPAGCVALTGPEVAAEILQWLGATKALQRATLVSYTLQDYDFWGQGTMTSLLRRQRANGAAITLLTTPPDGKPTRQEFRRKLLLLDELEQMGVTVYVNPDVHAKVYLFTDSQSKVSGIVGSTNFTMPALGSKVAGARCLLELAWVTASPDLVKHTQSRVGREIFADARTLTYADWCKINIQAVTTGRTGATP